MEKIKFINNLIHKIQLETYVDVGNFMMENISLVSNIPSALPFLEEIRLNISEASSNGVSLTALNLINDILTTTVIKIIFIGSVESFNDYRNNRNITKNIELHHIDFKTSTDIKAKVDELKSCNIICVYEFNLLTKVKEIIHSIPGYPFIPTNDIKLLLNIHIELSRKRTLHHHSLNQTLKEYLKNKHLDQLIVGSSYPWSAFPNSLLLRSSNLSMHCADITFSKSVIMGLSQIKRPKDVILLLSPYDLYYELSLSNNLDILTTFHSLKSFCEEQRIKYKTENSNFYEYIFNVNNTLENKTSSPLFIIDSLLQKPSSDKNEIISKLCLFYNNNKNNLQDPDAINQNAYKENDEKRKYSKKYQSVIEHKKSCIEKAIKHSKHINYEKSFEKNKNHIKELVNFSESRDIHLHIVLSPFPSEYIKNINQEMIYHSRNFLSNIQSKKFKFYDLLDEGSFGIEDYFDGDHLNFTGAQKLQQILKNLSVNL